MHVRGWRRIEGRVHIAALIRCSLILENHSWNQHARGGRVLISCNRTVLLCRCSQSRVPRGRFYGPDQARQSSDVHQTPIKKVVSLTVPTQSAAGRPDLLTFLCRSGSLKLVRCSAGSTRRVIFGAFHHASCVHVNGCVVDSSRAVFLRLQQKVCAHLWNT